MQLSKGVLTKTPLHLPPFMHSLAHAVIKSTNICVMILSRQIELCVTLNVACIPVPISSCVHLNFRDVKRHAKNQMAMEKLGAYWITSDAATVLH
jgi:hypothetical protein